MLKSVQIQVAPVRPPLLRPGSNTGRYSKTDLIIATTQRRLNLVIINRLGPFMDPSKPISGRRYNSNLRDDEFRAVILLHELGHLMDKFQAEGSYTVTNEEHTATVVRHCL